jgi:hypothetical protein
MPIENRELEVGTRLVAQYKGVDYALEVVQTDEGLRYRLADGREFRSPSSAGKEVMGGIACNGWRFWSVAGMAPVRRPRTEKAEKPTKKPSTKNATKTSAKKAATKKPAKGKRARPEDVPSYGCGGCGATFGSQKAAVDHALTHTAN